MNQPPASPYKAYSRAAHTVNKTRQVVMLYDGAIRFLQHAGEAIEKKDYETRYHKLVRVSDILMGLQSCLDFDVGGASAKVLFDFYSMMDRRVFALHRSNDGQACEVIIRELKEMRDVWDRIDRAQEASDAPPAKPADGTVADSPSISA
jgi:flagellar secretion chaperone FliS